ncbi:MAG: DUF3656 domain-containing U32 family peptidase [Oscillospiraceae bacterium]|jgi:putative protease
MLELLSPAGSPEAVVAAVQNGADAIYLGFGGFNARRGAKNFTDDEFDSAVRYCRVRGCKVYVTLNTLVSDREMDDAVKLACHACDAGADAILVQDLGLARVLREAVPHMPLHASTQMSIHSLAGVQAAAEMGMTRAVLARELGLEDIRRIAAASPIELEVFAHGAFCFCHSGQCYMSAVIGRRSGNRGECAQPCRMRYSLGGRMDDYPLSLKDNCLVQYLSALEDAGVKCVKIEGRMKRPEYSAIVTGIYSRAIRSGTQPTEREMQQLEAAFSRSGFTDGYYTGKKGPEMFGIRGEPSRETARLFSEAKKAYAHSELRRVPVKFYAIVRKGEKARFAVEDADGRKVLRDGPVPQTAQKQALTEKSIYDQFYKTGGTPYLCTGVSSVVEEGLFLPASVLNEARRALLDALTEERKQIPARPFGKVPPAPKNISVLGGTKRIFQVTTAEQLTPELAALAPDYLYVPVEVLVDAPSAAVPFAKAGVTPVAVLPRVITDAQEPQITAMLARAKAMGVEEALVGNLGHIRLARMAGMQVRGDFGLNAYNSDSLEVLREAGFLSATASFELRLSQIRDLRKPLPVEILAYGRLPLMISDQCIIKNSAGQCNCQNNVLLSDREGQQFPVMRAFGCRNAIYNSQKLWLADKADDLARCGLWAERLLFTNEGPAECVRVAEACAGKSDYVPNGMTRGLYYRGVE